MRNRKWALCLVLAALLVALTACGTQPETQSTTTSSAETTTAAATDPQGTGTAAFSYSNGLDADGFWIGVRALDSVEMFDYQAMTIPNDSHTVSDEDVQTEANNILSGYAVGNQVTDRAVAEGDVVNIDYVGSVGGVEFSGGSTGGAGADVTAGSPEYIDDFLTQLIGHKPGETFNVEVTFPEDYGVDELNGQDAVFVTTINYITETVPAEMTDAFIAANLSADHGWTNVAEMMDATRASLQKSAIQQYINQYFITEVSVKSVPDQMVTYQESAIVAYYQEAANNYQMTLDEYLAMAGYSGGIEEVLTANTERNQNAATFYLVVQAVAEDAGLSVSDEDLANYFAEHVGTSDYSAYEEQYGLPYLKQIVLCQVVLDYISDHAILA